MKDFLKHIFSKWSKVALLIAVNLFIFLVWYFLISDPSDNPIWVIILLLTFVSSTNFILIYQMWREYKGYEGFFGKK